jgi:hypothetical protein
VQGERPGRRRGESSDLALELFVDDGASVDGAFERIRPVGYQRLGVSRPPDVGRSRLRAGVEAASSATSPNYEVVEEPSASVD